LFEFFILKHLYFVFFLHNMVKQKYNFSYFLKDGWSLEQKQYEKCKDIHLL